VDICACSGTSGTLRAPKATLTRKDVKLRLVIVRCDMSWGGEEGGYRRHGIAAAIAARQDLSA